MFYETAENRHGLKYDPFKAIVSPRPIGWISSLSRNGIVNLAPYSFFNAVSERPHYVMFGSYGRKDSLANIEETGEFVCSIATWDLRMQMNKSSQEVGPDVDEMKLAGITPVPSVMVKPPRVAEAPAALECRHYQTIKLPVLKEGAESSYMVLGQVVGIYINEKYIEDGILDITGYRPLARLGYMDYCVVEEVFSMKRPAPDDI